MYIYNGQLKWISTFNANDVSARYIRHKYALVFTILQENQKEGMLAACNIGEISMLYMNMI